MVEVRFRVGVVAERRAVEHKWIDHVWEPVAVLPDEPETPAWTRLSVAGSCERFYIGATDLALASTDTAHYRDNLLQPPPRLWVVLREEGGETPLNLVTVTADPMEAEAHTESGANIVGAVTMDTDIAAVIARFVDEHHVERVFVKRKRKQHRDGEAQT